MRTLIVLCVLLFACNPARRIERAEQTVITRPESFNKVGGIWSALHPCANDTISITKLGETLVFIDTVLKHTRDTLMALDTVVITRRIYSRDTISFSIIDRQLVNQLKDSINRQNAKLGYSNGRYQELEVTLTNEKKRARRYLISFIALIVAFALGVVIKLKP
jgi:hypothetical protein